MSLDKFLYQLHFDVDKIRPPDWEVDWQDAPYTYKLYRGLPVIPLSPEVPLTLEEREVMTKPTLDEVAHVLWYVYGLTQFCQTVLYLDSTEQEKGLMQQYRRFIPSGGGLYPNELYVYLKLKDLPTGVYHYDVAHHRLVMLRQGEFDSYLAQALGRRCDLSECFATLFVSTMFWKNFFKYNDFAYRLQALDAGVLIGQLLEVIKPFGFAAAVYYQFLDRAVNHLLGLREQEESVYAVVPLSLKPDIAWFPHRDDERETITATELCKQLPALWHDHYIRSQRVLEYPMLIKMNEASMQETAGSFRTIERKETANGEDQGVALPFVKGLSYDLASACRKRFSPGIDFVLGRVSQEELSTLLYEAFASFSYRNDLDGGEGKIVSRLSLYGCLHHMEGIPDGAYSYDHEAHRLRQVRLGDHRHWLQQGMSLHNVNLFQVPLCLHVAGDIDHLTKELGYRGYRIQQMEAGILVQCLLLAASAIGMGGHPLLGFDANSCDEMYKMAVHGKTSLIQIPVGPYRPRPWLKGSLNG